MAAPPRLGESSVTRTVDDEPKVYDSAVVPMRACELCTHVLDRARHLFARAALEFEPAAQSAALRHRLAPDMFDLGQQAIVLADSLVGAAALLAGRTRADEPAVQWVFNRGDEASLGAPDADFDAVLRRLESARARVREIGALEGTRRALSGTAVIVVERPGHRRSFEAAAFMERYVTPNAYFHLAMMYALLRASGARLGKADFEGAPAYLVGD